MKALSLRSIDEGRRGDHPRGAFTLVELLVALGVTALLVGLMLTMVVTVLGLWGRSSGTLTTGNQARTVLDELARDLEGLVVRRDGNVWLAATIQPAQSGTGDAGMTGSSWTAGNGVLKPSGADSIRLAPPASWPVGQAFTIADQRCGHAGVWLRFFSQVPDANQVSGTAANPNLANSSAPRAVAYQIVRRQVGGAYAYQLFRSEARPAQSSTATAANNVFAVGYDLFMAADDESPSYNRGHGVEKNVGNIRRPNAAQVIANNVVDFGVRFLDSEGGLLFPVAATVPATFAVTGEGTRTAPAGVDWGPVTVGLPRHAEVMIRVLTDEGVRQIQALEAGAISAPAGIAAGEYWWQLAEQHSRVFSRRITIPATAL